MVSRALRSGYGKGSITYLGVLLDPATLSAFVKQALDASHVTSSFGRFLRTSRLTRRVADNHDVFILINHGKQRARSLYPPRCMMCWRAIEPSRASLSPLKALPSSRNRMRIETRPLAASQGCFHGLRRRRSHGVAR